MSDSSTTVSTPKAAKAKPARKIKSAARSSAATAQRAAILLKQAADPTRLQIIRMLKDGEMYVGQICASLGQSQPSVSHHLCLQRHGGIVECQRRGKSIWYSLTAKGRILATAVDAVMAEDAKGG